jgi:hypothetical protein
MKKILIGLMLVCFSLTAFALPNDEVELVLMSKLAQKKAVVLATMNLEGKKKTEFGNLYDEYQAKLTEALGEKLKVILDYAENYKKLDDKKANELLSAWFKANEKTLKLQSEYAEKFAKILSPVEVIRYMQIENHFRILSEAEMSDLVPLAEAPGATVNKNSK